MGVIHLGRNQEEHPLSTSKRKHCKSPENKILKYWWEQKYLYRDETISYQSKMWLFFKVMEQRTKEANRLRIEYIHLTQIRNIFQPFRMSLALEGIFLNLCRLYDWGKNIYITAKIFAKILIYGDAQSNKEPQLSPIQLGAVCSLLLLYTPSAQCLWTKYLSLP